MSAPREWWDDLQGKRPGPARIRVTFNRPFTEAEREHVRGLGVLVQTYVGDKFRLSPDDRVYVESTFSTSRELYDAVAAVVASSFVNVFPTAVRTFRERVGQPKGKPIRTPKKAVELRQVTKESVDDGVVGTHTFDSSDFAPLTEKEKQLRKPEPYVGDHVYIPGSSADIASKLGKMAKKIKKKKVKTP